MATSLERELVVPPGEGRETNVMMSILGSTDDFGGAFSVMQGVIQPHELLGPHSHGSADQAVFVLDGVLEFEIGGPGGSVFSASTGSFVLKPRGIEHTFWNPTDSPVPYLELSSGTSFEKFVLSRHEGGLVDTVKQTIQSQHDAEMDITMYPQHIPRLMKEHHLTAVATMDLPWNEDRE